MASPYVHKSIDTANGGTVQIWSDGSLVTELEHWESFKLNYRQAMELVSGLLQYATQLPEEERK